MADAEAPNEAFKRNTGAALRALSAVRELEVTFGPENATTDGRTARLPTPSRDLPPGEVAILRGEADALAMNKTAKQIPVINRMPCQTVGSTKSGWINVAAEAIATMAANVRICPACRTSDGPKKQPNPKPM